MPAQGIGGLYADHRTPRRAPHYPGEAPPILLLDDRRRLEEMACTWPGRAAHRKRGKQMTSSRSITIEHGEAGQTFVAYDNFVSLLAQYGREDITRVAQVVEQKEGSAP